MGKSRQAKMLKKTDYDHHYLEEEMNKGRKMGGGYRESGK